LTIGAGRNAGHQIEPEVADIRRAIVGNDHVIEVTGSDLIEIGVRDEVAGVLLAQQLVIAHRYHHHPAVG
jgi:hypothetical protein